jgi:hypothetical protein
MSKSPAMAGLMPGPARALTGLPADDPHVRLMLLVAPG